VSGYDTGEAALLPYQIPNLAIGYVNVPNAVRTGPWRSVDFSQHGFYTESFIDELAFAADKDPFEFRRDILPEGSRERFVLETVAREANWGSILPIGTGRGIALVKSFGTIVAEVVEVSLDPQGRPRVHRVVIACDCGFVVHPNTARQQLESGAIMGLSAALGEKIGIDKGRTLERNFSEYNILRLADTPKIEVHFVGSGGPLGGLGEPATPPAAPALANAVFSASGRRVRDLPIGRVSI
jgi:isoquinoline 1-oxidoreductase beta subunit